MSVDAPSLEALLASREVVVFCGSGGVGKTSVAAAAAAVTGGADRRARARPHHRSCSSARRCVGPRSGRERGAPSATGCLRRVGCRASGRALRGDARHEALVGRAGAPPRSRRRHRLPHPRQPDVPQRHQPVRAEPRLHRDGAPLRPPRERRLRPHRDRHATDAQRHRLSRGTGADGRVLRRPACSAGSPCRTG